MCSMTSILVYLHEFTSYVCRQWLLLWHCVNGYHNNCQFWISLEQNQVSVWGFLLSVTIATITIILSYFNLHPALLCVILFGCILRRENNHHQKLTCLIHVVWLLYWCIYMYLQVMYGGGDCSCDIVLTVITIIEWLSILSITRKIWFLFVDSCCLFP